MIRKPTKNYKTILNNY